MSIRMSSSSISIVAGLLEQRRDDHLREARVAAVRRVERAEAHEPVLAALGLEDPVRVLAPHGERGRLDPVLLARARLDHLGLEAALLGPAEVHAQQDLGPVLRVGAARVGLDRDDRVSRVVLAGEERVLLQPGELAAHVAQHGLELLVRERAHALAEELDVRDELVVALELLLRALVLGREPRGALLVVPEVGLRELLLELVEAGLQRSGVKGNHGPSRAGPRSPRAARRAGFGSRRPWRRPS